MIDHTDMGDQPAGTTEVLHYLHDVLGSVVALTNTNGQVVERYDYDPYGGTYIERPLAGTNSFSPADEQGNRILASRYGNPWMWTGQRRDATTGQYHFWARTYSPRMGRWLQRDPVGYIDGVNLYEYVASNPIRLIDPFGWLRRDKNGEIIKTPNGPPATAKHPSGQKATVQPVKMKTANGTEVDGYEYVSGDPGMKTDCHGCTFGDGKVWINDEEVDDILTGDGYRKRQPGCKQDQPKPGDVWIYRDPKTKKVVHSVKVTKVDQYGYVTEVEGLGGVEEKTSKKAPGPGPGTAWEKKADTEVWTIPPPPPPPRCFPAGTLVATPEGAIPIERMIGYRGRVVTINESRSELTTSLISAVHESIAVELVSIELENEVIECTSEHPFWTTGGWVTAGKLKSSMLLQDSQGNHVRILSIRTRRLHEPVVVYNITVTPDHCYFVGGSKILVHNKNIY